MTFSNIQVAPTEIVKTSIASAVDIRVMSLELGRSVALIVTIKDQNESVIDVHSITIEGEEYEGWGDDDAYLVNLVLEKIGLTKISV